MKRALALAAVAPFASACTGTPGARAGPSTGPAIKMASWNLGHLAEANGSDCRPCTDADYAAMRAYVDRLGADVIAFQEVESKAAAERVFDPSIYTVVIEERIGTDRGGECRGREGLTINAQPGLRGSQRHPVRTPASRRSSARIWLAVHCWG